MDMLNIINAVRAMKRFAAEQASGDTIVRGGPPDLCQQIISDLDAGKPAIIIPHTISGNKSWSVVVPATPFVNDQRTLGLWHFDGSADDSSSYGNNGSLEGTYSWSGGKFNQALWLDGGHAILPYENTRGRSRWLCFEAFISISEEGTLADAGGWSITVDSNGYVTFTVEEDSITSGIPITWGEWTYVMAQYSSSLYGDGDLWVSVNDIVRRTSTSTTVITNISDNIILGNNSEYSYNITGGIDEVRISDTNRFTDDGNVARARPSMLDVGVYNFESVAGTTVNSRLGESDMTIFNGASGAGVSGNGLILDGSGYGEVEFVGSYTPQAISLGGWCKFSSTNGTQTIIYRDSTPYLLFDGNALEAKFNDNDEPIQCQWTPNTNVWYEIYAVCDGEIGSIWINNQKWAEGPANLPSPNNMSGKWYVGSSGGNSDFFFGALDDIIITCSNKRRWVRTVPIFVAGQHGFNGADWQIA